MTVAVENIEVAALNSADAPLHIAVAAEKAHLPPLIVHSAAENMHVQPLNMHGAAGNSENQRVIFDVLQPRTDDGEPAGEFSRPGTRL